MQEELENESFIIAGYARDSKIVIPAQSGMTIE
jgi:hypothetical protein